METGRIVKYRGLDLDRLKALMVQQKERLDFECMTVVVNPTGWSATVYLFDPEESYRTVFIDERQE